MDKFRIETLAATPNPQQVIWAAMHQDYSEEFVLDRRDKFPEESRAGELIVKHLLAGDRGHYGCLEHPQITLNVGYFPHSMMQQLRTHRVGVSFDVQCLAGETKVTFVDASGNSIMMKIAELYDRWKEVEFRLEKGTTKTQRKEEERFRRMRLRVLNEATGLFQIGHLKDVICSGLQPVYRLTLADGKILDCTTNHRLLTSKGWQRMGDALGLVVDSERRVLGVTSTCELMCNGVYLDSDRTVLLPKLSAHPVAVIGVEYLGIQTTYDLEVEGDWHNFVANGVVVHNSFRYTGQRIIDVATGKRKIDDVFYLRPVGKYTDRQGKHYNYTEAQRSQDLDWCFQACQQYQQRIEEGLAEEHARGLIPFDARQHFVLSCNTRSLMHLLDLRWKKDAQLEAQKFCELLYLRFEEWCPAIAHWYKENRAKKAKLSP